MELLGYFFSIIIGITLGLMGSGGSILMVPVLVYIFQIEAQQATFYSLLIVGITTGIGAFRYLKQELVSLKTVFLFGFPSIVGVLLARKLILPIIPENISITQNIVLNKNTFLLILFAVLMIVSAFYMIAGSKKTAKNEQSSLQIHYIIIVGFFVGMLTGMIGAGGGFIIIPSLIFFLNCNMKSAVGTSLSIICINTLFGFFSDVFIENVPWQFLITISACAILGIIIGTFLSKKIQGEKLKPIFGIFILAMGIYILIKELF